MSDRFMSDRFKYSLKGSYRCENFAEHYRQNYFPRVPIGSVGGIDEWFVMILEDVFNNEPVVYPMISCLRKPKLSVHTYFNIIKNDGTYTFPCTGGNSILEPDFGKGGAPMEVAKLLDEDNGYLDNGALTVEYGIQVEAILGEDKIWRFNIHDKSFNSPTQNQMVELCDAWSQAWHTHKQFSSNFDHKEFERHVQYSYGELIAGDLLQILHGVQIQFNKKYFDFILPIAYALSSPNLIRYCDQQMLEYLSESPIAPPRYGFLFEVNDYGLRRSLVHLVDRCETLEKLVEIIKMLGVENLSGEAMKTFLAKMFTCDY